MKLVLNCTVQYGPGDSEVRRLARQMVENIFETEEEEVAAIVTAQPTDYEFSHPSAYMGLHGSVSMSLPANAIPNSRGRGSGVGRGSHLVRPAWMTPN